MAHNRYVKGKDGKFAGSIGEGKTNVPTTQAPLTTAGDSNQADPNSSVSDAYAKFQDLTQSETPFTKRYDTPQERTAAYMAEIDKGMTGFEDQEEYRKWLDFCGTFHNYSVRNQILLLAQSGGQATQVAGYKQWLARGRHVKKGEHGLAILVPLVKKRTKVNDDGEEETTTSTRGFRLAPVFDVAQTEGDELPSPYKRNTEVVPAGFRNDLEQAIQARGYTITEEDLGSAAHGGHTMKQSKRVVINSSLTDAEKVQTLAHELAHIEAGHMDVDPKEYHSGSGGKRPEMEVEAESIAYVLCRENGMSTQVGNQTYTYIGGWAKNDRKLLEATTRNIGATVNRLLAGRDRWTNANSALAGVEHGR